MIHPFFKDMNTVINNGLPCPWDDNITLHTVEVYNRLLQDAMPRLNHMLNKFTIPTATKILNQLKPFVAMSALLRSMIQSLGDVDYMPYS